MLISKSFFVGTTTGIDIINVGHDIRAFLREAKLENGSVTVTFRLSGASLAVLKGDGRGDMKKEIESLPPAYLRLLPPSLTFPVEKGKFSFEPWQDLYLIDFEPTARRREVVLQMFFEEEVKKKT